MNQYTSSTASKRVPGQYHLTLHTQPIYGGLPLLNCAGGFVSEYLERLYCAIQRTTQRYSKVFAVRVDLHFPQYYSSIDHSVLSNEYLHLFIKSLRGQLKKYSDQRRQSGQRVHEVGFNYVWAREYGPESEKPHFHLLLLFNGHAFNTLGCFSDDCESLYNRIGLAWAEALKIHSHESTKYVHFPVDAQYQLRSVDRGQLVELFRRASYLAKLASKSFHDGCHVFGGGRL